MGEHHRRRDDLERLRLFAESLGWSDLQRLTKQVPEEAGGGLIVWYEAGDCPECGLQINETPTSMAYFAAVYAMRYRIYSGWHRFNVDSMREVRREAAQLDYWLHQRWFNTLQGRRQYRENHPRSAGVTWPRLRNLYQPDDTW